MLIQYFGIHLQQCLLSYPRNHSYCHENLNTCILLENMQSVVICKHCRLGCIGVKSLDIIVCHHFIFMQANNPFSYFLQHKLKFALLVRCLQFYCCISSSSVIPRIFLLQP